MRIFSYEKKKNGSIILSYVDAFLMKYACIGNTMFFFSIEHEIGLKISPFFLIKITYNFIYF